MDFKGHDWSELFNFFHLESFGDSCYEDREQLAKFLQRHQEEKYVVSACREYVKVLAEQCHRYCYSGPVWDGLVNVEDDNTFIQHFILLLPMAWS